MVVKPKSPDVSTLGLSFFTFTLKIMNKPYFTKYLPVEGEIELGWVRDENIRSTSENQLVKIIESGKWGYRSEKGEYSRNCKNVTQVKLFLCSRDIQVGDKYFYQSYEGFKEDVAKRDFVNIDSPSCFKVIGEVSPGAIWVKEDDEFEEDEIGRCFAPREWPTGKVKIKCPTCQTFH